jgi:putative spermidine/putrescine transport system permease protein
VVTIAAVLKSYDQRLDQAAATLGANRLRTLVGVTIPLVKGGLVAAFLFAFITSFDELTIAIFVSGGIKTTLPKQMWDDMILQLNPTWRRCRLPARPLRTDAVHRPAQFRRTAGGVARVAGAAGVAG